DSVVGRQNEASGAVKGDVAGSFPERGAGAEHRKAPGAAGASVGGDAAALLALKREGLVDRVKVLAAGGDCEVGRVTGDGGGADRADASAGDVEGGGEDAIGLAMDVGQLFGIA